MGSRLSFAVAAFCHQPLGCLENQVGRLAEISVRAGRPESTKAVGTTCRCEHLGQQSTVTNLK